MVCEHCLDLEATVTITKKSGGTTQTLGLCDECAAKVGFHSPLDEGRFPLSELLVRLFDNPESFDSGTEASEFSDAIPDLTCPNCHLTYREFTRTGRFGCGQCYREFRGRIENIMLKIHGSSKHVGHVPQIGFDGMSAVQQEETLQRALTEAVEREDYEKAAELRDSLRVLRDSKNQPQAQETEAANS